MHRLAASCFFLALVATSLATPFSLRRIQAFLDRNNGLTDYDQVLPYPIAETPVIYPGMNMIENAPMDEEMTRQRRNPLGKRYACRFKFCRIFDA